jgi:hypothetical protein
MKKKLAITFLGAAIGSFALAGTASAATVTTSTDSVDFGSQKVGTTSAAKPVTLNVPCLYVLDLGQYGGKSCSAPGRIEGVATSGDFAQTHDCVLPISNSSVSGEVVSCTIFVSFTPSQTGNRDGKLTFTSYGSAGEYPVSLIGAGVVPSTQTEGDTDKKGKGAEGGSNGTAGTIAKKCKKAKKGRKAKKCKRPRK